MNKMSPEQFDRLPKFVQAELSLLREKVSRLEADVAWLRDENRVKVEASNTVVTEGLHNDTALIPFSNVEFRFKDEAKKHWKAAVTVRMSRDEKSIEIHGTDQLGIAPVVSNHLRIWLRD